MQAAAETTKKVWLSPRWSIARGFRCSCLEGHLTVQFLLGTKITSPSGSTREPRGRTPAFKTMWCQSSTQCVWQVLHTHKVRHWASVLNQILCHCLLSAKVPRQRAFIPRYLLLQTSAWKSEDYFSIIRTMLLAHGSIPFEGYQPVWHNERNNRVWLFVKIALHKSSFVACTNKTRLHAWKGLFCTFSSICKGMIMTVVVGSRSPISGVLALFLQVF